MTLRQRWYHKKMDAAASSAFAKYSDVIRISAEITNISLYPLQSKHLIFHAHVSRTFFDSQIQKTCEPISVFNNATGINLESLCYVTQHVYSVIEGDQNHISIDQMIGAV